MSKKFIILGSLIGGLIMLLMFQNAAETSPASMYTVFNKPDSRKETHTIRDEILNLISAAPRGSSIRTSIFGSGRLEVAEALVAAKKSGVDVRVILDDSWKESSERRKFAKTLVDGLGEQNVIKCKYGGCMAHEGNNHNKFYIFSETKVKGRSARHVSVQTSSNMTTDQYQKYNDMVVFVNDSNIFSHYYRYWKDMSEQTYQADYVNNPTGNTHLAKGKSKSGLLPVAVYSSTSLGKDYILEYLRRAKCMPGRGRIDFTHSIFKKGRGLNFLNELRRLKDEGCEVNVIFRAAVKEDMLALARAYNLNLVVIGKGETNIHSKLTLIDAWFQYEGQYHRRQIVFAGSQNMGNFSFVHNDDTVVRIKDKKIHSDYQAYVDHIIQNSRTGPKTVSFGCSAKGSNKGCSGVAKCKSGFIVQDIKAACNLETSSLPKDILSKVPNSIVRILRTSDSAEAGLCQVGSTQIHRGEKPIQANGSKVNYACSEHDKNGGDCVVQGELKCVMPSSVPTKDSIHFEESDYESEADEPDLQSTPIQLSTDQSYNPNGY